MRTKLPSLLASQFKRRIRAIWGVTDSHYWYPLSTIGRPDLIAFDSDYYIEEDDQKLRKSNNGYCLEMRISSLNYIRTALSGKSIPFPVILVMTDVI